MRNVQRIRRCVGKLEQVAACPPRFKRGVNLPVSMWQLAMANFQTFVERLPEKSGRGVPFRFMATHPSGTCSSTFLGFSVASRWPPIPEPLNCVQLQVGHRLHLTGVCNNPPAALLDPHGVQSANHGVISIDSGHVAATSKTFTRSLPVRLPAPGGAVATRRYMRSEPNYEHHLLSTRRPAVMHWKSTILIASGVYSPTTSDAESAMSVLILL